jgi:hypothetical protein
MSATDVTRLRNGAAYIAREMRRKKENPDEFLSLLADKLQRATRDKRAAVPPGLKGVLTEPSPGLTLPGAAKWGMTPIGATPGGAQVRRTLPKAVQAKEFTYRQLETLRQAVADFGAARPKTGVTDPRNPALSDQTRRAMNNFYTFLTQVYQGHPGLEMSQRVGKQLRDIEAVMQPEKLAQMPDGKLLSAFFRRDGLLGENGRLKALKDSGTKEDYQQAAAWLYMKLLNKKGVFNKETGILNGTALKNAMSEDGSMLSRDVLDTMLPGVADELLETANLVTKMQKGVLRPAGSDTAGRLQGNVESELAIAGIVGMVVAMAHNQWSAVNSVLGLAGLRTVLNILRRDVIEQSSPIGRGVASMLRGQPPAIGQAAVAAQQVPNPLERLQGFQP